MAKLIALLVLLCVTGTIAAQDAAKDKEAQDRVRAEGAAGGTGQRLSKEQREAVKSGERQHRTHREVLDRAKRDQPKGELRDEQSSDRQKGRGAH